MKRIVLTGGGTAGHVTPHIALLPELARRGFEPHYIGSREGVERGLIEQIGLPYYGISSGKLRRYLNIKNLTDIFRVARGLSDALSVLKKIKPSVVFSKGGFVTVPVVFAAKLLGIPVVLHESDITPGLANKLSAPFAKAICCAFPETTAKLPKKKAVFTGTPIRAELFEGRRGEALHICGFTETKPTLLCMGGSLGAKSINRAVLENLPVLLETFNVIHICGKGNMQESQRNGYAPFEYVSGELPHLFALADIVLTRAGANTLFELLALRKPHLLIPLPRSASRGDQILNAESFEKQNYSMVLQEEELTGSKLCETLIRLYNSRHDFIRRYETRGKSNADVINEVMNVIEGCTI